MVYQPMSVRDAVYVSKREFRLIYKAMTLLVKKLNKRINKELTILDVCHAARNRYTIALNHSKFKQAWRSVCKGEFPVYTIIHLKQVDNVSECVHSYTEDAILEALNRFSTEQQFHRINNKIVENMNSYIGRRKNRFSAEMSGRYPWFSIYARGKLNSENSNFRIIVKANYVFSNEENVKHGYDY